MGFRLQLQYMFTALKLGSSSSRKWNQGGFVLIGLHSLSSIVPEYAYIVSTCFA